jgi:hypothetical protein
VATTKFAADIGDGTSRIIELPHPLATTDLLVQVFRKSDGAEIECEIERSSPATITLRFTSPPPTSSLRVVIVG